MNTFLFQQILIIAVFSSSSLNLFGQFILNSDQSVLSSKHARLKDLVVKKSFDGNFPNESSTAYCKVYRLDSMTIATLSLWYIQFLSDWSGKKIECTVHVALLKWPMHWFLAACSWQSRKQALGTYCSIIYIVTCCLPKALKGRT